AGDRVDRARAGETVDNRVFLAAPGRVGHEGLGLTRLERGAGRTDADHVGAVIAAAAKDDRETGLGAEVHVALVIEATGDDVRSALEAHVQPTGGLEAETGDRTGADVRLLNALGQA